MRTKVQFIAPLTHSINIYYVRDRFGRTWHTVGYDEENAKKDIYFKNCPTTFILYQPSVDIEMPPKYDFKNIILDMLEQMLLSDTYEYEIVCGWTNDQTLKFIKSSSLNPLDLLLEINRENQNNNMGVLL
ncbi:hypothetical protein J2W98_003607 [Paenibacillus peoriae]|uniref:DUF2750 domain-containing protein n=1 Tax=Paenibacillus peoriae TaxID=59893 RepID=A0ABU1QI98_9BACL|nr:hypothetical protein [Paenibacillus peoriae]MDR6779327.1 hypothetical protein [Paenibacillus peoriae]